MIWITPALSALKNIKYYICFLCSAFENGLVFFIRTLHVRFPLNTLRMHSKSRFDRQEFLLNDPFVRLAGETYTVNLAQERCFLKRFISRLVHTRSFWKCELFAVVVEWSSAPSLPIPDTESERCWSC